MHGSSERPKGYRFPKVVISYAVYLCHRFLPFVPQRAELMLERSVDISHETILVWCAKFGPDPAEVLCLREPRRGWLDEMRVVLGGAMSRGDNEHDDVLDVLLQEHRDTGATKRFFRSLIDNQELPERVVTDRLRSYGAVLREPPELSDEDGSRLTRVKI